MAASSASRYAAVLHRRTHRVTSALAYAALEWVLIALLLLNGLLSHAVARFAAYFGLRPPCLLCSRADRFFGAEEEDAADQAAGDARWLRGLLCGAHAAEISGMGYCLHHRRLVADAADMCEGCLSSWKKEMMRDAEEEGAVVCSCCKALVQIPSSRAFEDDTHAREDPAVLEKTAEEEEQDQGYVLLDQEDHEDEEEVQQNEEEAHEQQGEIKVAAVEDESLEFMAQGEEITPVDDDRLVPVVALDEMTIADDSGLHSDAPGSEEDDMNRTDDERDPDDLDAAVVLEEKRMLASSVATMPAMTENSVPQDDELVLEDTVETGDFRTDEGDILVPQATEAIPEDGSKSAEVETNCEVSIGGDICEQEQDGHAAPFQELVALEELFSPLEYADDRTSPLEILHETAPADQEASEAEHEVTASQRFEYQSNGENEEDEDRAPETPTYSFAAQNSGKRFLLERKRSLSLSLDGSVSSEVECAEPSTVDQLRSALQAERKTLSAMYAELEEERNAAAIATNQTMAMINRLQEEKAAMQMEALQYQRMMEEQSEYDQEAMQLLTELVTKREREKQELERELELCKQKVLHYEDRERRRMPAFKDNARSTNGNGTSESSSGEDSDENSDDSCELGESPSGNLQSSPDAVLSPRADQENAGHLVALDDSLTYMEMERLSILEELKALEERLFTLEDDDINGSNAAADRSSDDYGMSADGPHSPGNGLAGNKARFEGRASVSRGKSLLPLFDAVGDRNCDRPSSTEADDLTKPAVAVFAKEQERLAIIEEVDHVYERLQALEADKEFLRHCIKSLKKGDKGMHLLQEILQHLRELRSVELHAKHAGDAIATKSA
ncbi:myosin-binding protein 2-like [Triticum dicoccoides]|uniref:myosin-binding protein 2-like n=1 Tax=Triticum dicoccoides TaxID=85692 RepID=UPI0018908E4E|nr:myosin-binding protein 2-like [Triticum dicoccoides]